MLLEDLVEMQSPSCVSASVLSAERLALKAGQSGPLVSLCQKYAFYTQVLCFCLYLAPDTCTCAHHIANISSAGSITDSLHSKEPERSVGSGSLTLLWSAAGAVTLKEQVVSESMVCL